MNPTPMKSPLAILLLAAATPALAAAETITVKVNGLVCDFCARAIEKTMQNRPGVAAIAVDLDMGEIKLSTTENAALDDATLTRLVTDSGYAVTAISRKPRR